MARKQRKQGNTGSLKGFIIFLLLIAGAVWFTQGSSYQLPDLRKELPDLHEEKPSAAQSAPLTGNQEKVSSQMEIPRNLTNRKERILKRTGYTLSYNSFYKTPNWVAWELTRKETEGKAERYDKFLPDPDLPEPRVEHSDYTRSGYDRGHMAPAADMKWSKKAMQESFYMSNICPQNQKLNRDDWGDLEDACRKWAREIWNGLHRLRSHLRQKQTGTHRKAPGSRTRPFLQGCPDQQPEEPHRHGLHLPQCCTSSETGKIHEQCG